MQKPLLRQPARPLSDLPGARQLLPKLPGGQGGVGGASSHTKRDRVHEQLAQRIVDLLKNMPPAVNHTGQVRTIADRLDEGLVQNAAHIESRRRPLLCTDAVCCPHDNILKDG